MSEESPKRKRLNRRTWAAALLLLLVLGLILCGSLLQTTQLKLSLFGRPVTLRLHYAVSLLVIVLAMVPFFLTFEKRRPQARELVIIATLSAIAVLGRAIFFMLPNFKPVCAIVIIAGVCFGGEAGFLVGAVTGFVSNFFFQQGLHTPWQMVCFGLVGFFAGALFSKGLLKKKRISLCVYGFLATFFLYGGVINLSTVFLAGEAITRELIFASYLSAIIPDLTHAVSTVVFLLLLSPFMIQTLDRIKMKYGLMEP